MVAGKKLLDMHKTCTKNLKKIKQEKDRKVIQELTQTKLFSGDYTGLELATLLRVFRDISFPKPDDDDVVPAKGRESKYEPI